MDEAKPGQILISPRVRQAHDYCLWRRRDAIDILGGALAARGVAARRLSSRRQPRG
jgi:hypothetical protein